VSKVITGLPRATYQRAILLKKYRNRFCDLYISDDIKWGNTCIGFKDPQGKLWWVVFTGKSTNCKYEYQDFINEQLK